MLVRTVLCISRILQPTYPIQRHQLVLTNRRDKLQRHRLSYVHAALQPHLSFSGGARMVLVTYICFHCSVIQGHNRCSMFKGACWLFRRQSQWCRFKAMCHHLNVPDSPPSVVTNQEILSLTCPKIKVKCTHTYSLY